MAKITIVDIQHKQFKRKLQGYDPADVDQYLDELIETLEDEAQQRAALDAEIADLRERISHFKAMEESLQHTLLLAQRTADEVKASAHKEADLIRQEARVASEREIAAYGDRTSEARRDHQRAFENAEKAKSELRSLLMTHLALLERTPPGAPEDATDSLPTAASRIVVAAGGLADEGPAESTAPNGNAIVRLEV
ncbi:MAG: DivIVA domain-containing protein [Candidatus Dormibacteria bacterium]